MLIPQPILLLYYSKGFLRTFITPCFFSAAMAGRHISPWSPLRCWLRGRRGGGAAAARGTFWGTLIGCCAAAARPTLPLLPCASGASMSSP